MTPTDRHELPSERPAGLRDVPWLWSDGLSAVAFLLPWRILLLLPRA